MRIIDKLEEELLDLTPEERLANIKDIAYFIQCAAQMKKAEGGKGKNPFEVEITVDNSRSELDESTGDTENSE